MRSFICVINASLVLGADVISLSIFDVVTENIIDQNMEICKYSFSIGCFNDGNFCFDISRVKTQLNVFFFSNYRITRCFCHNFLYSLNILQTFYIIKYKLMQMTSVDYFQEPYSSELKVI